jgi:hypothetical protein
MRVTLGVAFRVDVEVQIFESVDAQFHLAPASRARPNLDVALALRSLL